MIQPPVALFEARPALRVGFSRGDRFTDGLLKARLEGFEFGADLPIAPKSKLSVSPTMVLGGSNRTGGDTDGNLYRLMLTLRGGIVKSGFYGGLGAGFSLTEARSFAGAGAATGDPSLNKAFRDTSGLTGQLILGFQKGNRFIELSQYHATDSKLRGISLQVGVRL